MSLLLYSTLCVLLAASTGVYVDQGDPYEPGTLPTSRFSLSEALDHSPLHTTVITPTTPGDYAFLFFITGLDGILTANTYQRYLNDVAQHGYIVSASDLIFPGDGPQKQSQHKHRVEFITDEFVKQFFWLKSNLEGYLTKTAPNVTCNFDHVGLFSHSAGADGVFKMAERNHTLFKSVVFFEPSSFNFNKPTTFSLPAMIIGTVLSTVKGHECIIPGFGYNHFYKMWALPPKVLMEVKNYGHCDIIDDINRDFCVWSKVCLGGNSTSLPAYHRFAQGVTSAFFTASLQGRTDAYKYVLDVKNIPLPLAEFKSNFTIP